MSMAEKKLIKMDPNDLIPYEKNARIHSDESLQILMNSISTNDFLDPIEVDRNMVIVSGHGRRLAALKLGLKEVDVIVHEDLTPEKADEYRLTHNRSAEMSSWNWELVDELVGELSSDFNMADFGFFDDTIDEFDPEEFMEEPEDVAPQRGMADGEEQYKLIVFCTNAGEQSDLKDEMESRGFDCRAIL